MHNRLTPLIGSRFLYRGRTWLLVEVMRSEDALVITPEKTFQGRPEPVQTDQYGQAIRRCPECLTLPISGTDEDSYSEAVMELLSGRLVN